MTFRHENAGRFFYRIITRLEEKPGYTLIELILAILLTAIAFPAIAVVILNLVSNSLDAEIMTMANLLAQEQMEIILADKAGTGAGYGYAEISSAKYTSVNPGSPYNSFSRSVSISAANLQGNANYPAKIITVTVTHAAIPPVVLTAFVLDHSSL